MRPSAMTRVAGMVIAIWLLCACAAPGSSSVDQSRGSTQSTPTTPAVPTPAPGEPDRQTGSVLSTDSNADVERSAATTVSWEQEYGQPRFVAAWAPEGTEIVVSTFGSSACTEGPGRPVVIGVTEAAGSQSVVIALEQPAFGTTVTCLADNGRSDFFVALPKGFVRSKPLDVEIDGETVHLNAVDPTASTPSS